MAEENLTQVYYIENTQPYTVIDITEVSIPFYVEITDQAHDSTLIEVEDLPIPAVACYIENSKVFNITMDSSGRDGKDGLPGKDGIGIPGKDGTSFSFENLTSEQKALLLQPAITQINNLWASITSLQQLFANTVLNDWFYLDENGNVGTNYNLYSTKEISAYGIGTDETPGTGGAINLNDLVDVVIDDLTLTDNQILVYDITVEGGKWVNKTIDAFTLQYLSLAGGTMSNTNLVTNLNADLLDGKEGTYYTNYVDTKVASKLDTSIFNSHASNNDANVKHLTDTQLNYLNNLISWWKIDANGNLYTEKNLYSTLEVSAYGAGTGSEGNGGATLLDDLTDVTIVNPLNNQFLVYNFSTKQWENQTISFTPASHSHSISDITGLQNNLTFLYDHTTNTTVHITQEDRDYLNNLKTWWRFNTESQKLWTPYDVYSEGEISAYGAGSGESDGTSYSRLDSWLSYDSSKSGWVLSALLGKDLDNRVSSLESGPVITVADITNWNSAYTHSTSEHQNIINGTGFVKASGKTLSYDNNTYALNSALTLHTEDNVIHHTHDNKTIIDQLSQSNLDVLSKLSLIDGKLQISVDTYSTGELSAYGAGEGGSGSSYSRLDTWASYDTTKANWVLSALLGNDLNTRVASLESGSTTTVTITGTGNAITAISKSGATITATKGLTFSEVGHTHTKANIIDFPASMPASDVYAWAKASTKPSYIASEIGGLGASYRWLTDTYISTWNAKEPAITKGTTSQYFRGDMSLALFPTALPASDVYSWAKASTKPSYVWSEIGSKPTTLSGYGITDAVTLNTEQYITANKTFTGGINGFVKQASKTNPAEQPVLINGTGGATLGESAAIGFHNPGRNYSSIVYHDGLFKFMNNTMSGYNGIIASTGNFTDLTANYIPKQTASGLANSIIYDNGTNVGIGTTNPQAKLDVFGFTTNTLQAIFARGASDTNFRLTAYNGSGSTVSSEHAWFGMDWNNVKLAGISFVRGSGANAKMNFQTNTGSNAMSIDFSGNVGIGTTNPTTTLDVNGIGKFKDDILMTFKTTAWSYDTSKSLKLFLDKFDIDTAGNLVVKTNLYSTGEVTAYSSGTGVSGLKLMADMNANGKAIYSVNYLQAGLSVQGGSAIIGSDPLDLFGTGMNVGLYNADNDTVIAAYDDYNGMFYYANNSVTFSNYTNALQSPAFKFGNWTFRQDASGRLGIYNGATEVACFTTDGTYVNL